MIEVIEYPRLLPYTFNNDVEVKSYFDLNAIELFRKAGDYHEL